MHTLNGATLCKEVGIRKLSQSKTVKADVRTMDIKYVILRVRTL